jgi:hypothetical protein
MSDFTAISPPSLTDGREAVLPGFIEPDAPGRGPLIVHVPRLWASQFSLRINWLTKNFARTGEELPIEPPAGFEVEDPAHGHDKYSVRIGGMDGPRSEHFVSDRHLSLRAARGIMAMLTLRPAFTAEFQQPRLSLRTLCRLLKTGGAPDEEVGGKRLREVAALVELLSTFWVSSERPWSNQIEARPLITFSYNKRTDGTKVISRWLTDFAMEREFVRAIDQDSRAIRFDVLNQFQSELLQSWYLVIPCLASHPHVSAATPWQRNLRSLFHAAGVSYKDYGAKQFRYERGGQLAVAQMDGAETMSGRLRVRLRENTDRDDWKLEAWIERSARPKLGYNPEGYLFTFWLAAGRPKEEFEERLRRGPPDINAYDEELLHAAHYPVEKKGNRVFLRQVKALVGESRFQLTLSEAKTSVAEYYMRGGCQPGAIVGTALKDAYAKMLAGGVR